MLHAEGGLGACEHKAPRLPVADRQSRPDRSSPLYRGTGACEQAKARKNRVAFEFRPFSLTYCDRPMFASCPKQDVKMKGVVGSNRV